MTNIGSQVTDRWGSGFNDQMCVLSMETQSAQPLRMHHCLDQGVQQPASGAHSQFMPSTASCRLRSL